MHKSVTSLQVEMEKAINSTDFSAQLAMPECWGNLGFPPLTLKRLEPAVIWMVKAIAVTAHIRYNWSPSQMPSFTGHDSHLVKRTFAKSSLLLASPCQNPGSLVSDKHASGQRHGSTFCRWLAGHWLLRTGG